jgi:hypothetical protein
VAKGDEIALDLRFPVGGLDKRLAYKQQPPYTTPDADNVRPFDTIEGRERGGSRPGLIKHLVEKCSTSSTSIYTLSDVPHDMTGRRFLLDKFPGTTAAGHWTTATWSGWTSTLHYDGDLVYLDASTEKAALIWEVVSDIDETTVYNVSIFIPAMSPAHYAKFYLFAKMADSSPNVNTAGLWFDLDLEGDTYNLDKYEASSKTDLANGSITAQTLTAGWMHLIISSNTYTGYWNGEQLFSQTSAVSGAGTRFGFGIEHTASSTDFTAGTFKAAVAKFRCEYASDNADYRANKRALFAVSDRTVYGQDDAGLLTTSTTGPNKQGDGFQGMAIERAGTVYMNNPSTPLEIDDDGITDAAGTAFTDAGGTNFATLGVTTDHCVRITGGTGVTAGLYNISAVVTTTITLADSAGASASAIEFRIERPPISWVFNSTESMWEADGGPSEFPPSNSKGIVKYRDRAVLFSPPEAPYRWSMSKQGDYEDWDYAPADETDPQRAIDGANADAGDCPEAINAAAPWGDDYLLFGCESSLWVLRGDPAFGGLLDNVSRYAGILAPKAWCFTPDGYFAFLSSDGVMVLSASDAGPGKKLEYFSQNILPEELRNINPEMFWIDMEYDRKHHGIFLSLTGKDRTLGNSHWWMDWRTRTFWPESYANGHEPFCLLWHESWDKSSSALLLGCRDGWIREHSPYARRDDDTAISSYVTYGPISLGRNVLEEGMVTELTAHVPTEDYNCDIDWAVRRGQTAREAFANTTDLHTGTWNSQNLQRTAYPRTRGGAVCLKISNGNNDRWALETVGMRVRNLGRRRP